MSAEYPGGIFDPRTKENKSGVVYDAGKKTVGFAEDFIKLDEEVVAIETELGTDPKGAKADVKTRLNDVDTALGLRYTKTESDTAFFGKAVSNEINNLTLKATPVTADTFIFENSQNSFSKVKLYWDDIKTALKTYFDTLYTSLTTFNTHKSRHASGGADALTDKDQQDKHGISFIIDGGGSAITTGIKGAIVLPFKCEIISVRMVTDQSGSIVVDLWKDSYANYPPTDADSITASAPPTISATNKMEDTTLTGWSKTLNQGDILYFNVDSVTTVEWASIILRIKRVN